MPYAVERKREGDHVWLHVTVVDNPQLVHALNEHFIAQHSWEPGELEERGTPTEWVDWEMDAEDYDDYPAIFSEWGEDVTELRAAIADCTYA